MRFATFVFLTIYLFTSSTAYAILPAGGLIAGGLKTGGTLIAKKGTKTVLIGGTLIVADIIGDRLVKWCKSNKKACKDKIGDAYEVIFGGDDGDGSGGCLYHFGAGHENAPWRSAYDDYRIRVIDEFNASNSSITRKIHPNWRNAYDNFVSEYSKDEPKTGTYYYHLIQGPVYFYAYRSNLSQFTETDTYSIMSVRVKCGVDDNDEINKYRHNQLMDALRDKLSDDEFTQIINNYGDKNEFDIIINNCTGDNSCIELDPEFAQEVNNTDYDANKMSKDNCKVKNGKIVSCDNAKRKKKDKDDDDDKKDNDKDTKKKDKDDDDDDDKKDKKDKDDDDKSKPKYPKRHDDDDDDPPSTCDSSKFHKKICDWIDWTQDEQEFDDDGRVKPDDLSKKLDIDDDKIRFNRACPSGQTVRISFGGINISHQISYDGLCQAFSKMRPFVVGMGFVVGGMIIGGRRV